jgi:hypothetical protein
MQDNAFGFKIRLVLGCCNGNNPNDGTGYHPESGRSAPALDIIGNLASAQDKN